MAINPEHGANGMTALYMPDGIEPPKLVAALGSRDIVIAAGLHAEIKTKYVRFGHLGLSITPERKDVDVMIKALEESFAELKSAQ